MQNGIFDDIRKSITLDKKELNNNNSTINLNSNKTLSINCNKKFENEKEPDNKFDFRNKDNSYSLDLLQIKGINKFSFILKIQSFLKLMFSFVILQKKYTQMIM